MNDPLDLLQIKIDQAKAELPAVTREAIERVDWKKSLIDLRTKKGYTFEQLSALELETELVLCGIVPTENYPKELEARMKLPKARVDELVAEMNDLVFSRIRAELIKISERNKTVKVKIDVEAKPAPEPKPIFIKPKIDSGTAPKTGEPTPEKANLNLPELEMPKHEHDILKEAGIHIVDTAPAPQHTATSILPPEPVPAPNPAPAPNIETLVKKIEMRPEAPIIPKLSGNFQMPSQKTEYALPADLDAKAGHSNLSSDVMRNIKPISSEEAKASPSYSIKSDPYRELPE